MEAIRGFYENYIRWSAASMTLSDVLEIAIFTYFIYHIILWIKQSKAWILLKGAAAIFAMYILAVILQLNNIVMVFNRIAPYVATALLVIFQPEIRRALEQLGTNHLFELFSLSSTKDKVAENADDTIDAIVRASFSMGRAKTGALIVIEQKFVLNEYIATGILLDAIVSAPLLVQIFIIYFALPVIIGQRIDPFVAAVAACSINSGAYVAEIFRAGIQSIDIGQMRAGLSLGMNWSMTMRYIILPQAFKRIIPPLGNEFIAMLKDSSLVSVIGFEELTRSGQLIIAETYGSLEIWSAVAVIYLVMTLTITRLVSFLEKRFKTSDAR